MAYKEEHQKIGLNVLYQRRLRGWTQEELSSRSGISRARISDIENGKETFTLVSIMSLGEAFEIDYRGLLKYRCRKAGMKWKRKCNCLQMFW